MLSSLLKRLRWEESSAMAQLLRGSPSNKGFASVQPFFPTEGSGDRFAQWAVEVSDFLIASGAQELGQVRSGKTIESSFDFQGGLIKIKASLPEAEAEFAEVLIATKHPNKRAVAERLASLANPASALTTTSTEAIPLPATNLEPTLDELETDIDSQELELEPAQAGPTRRGFFSLSGFSSGRGFSVAPRQ
ncbi:hypothetical protein LCGC14_0422090 [marine sediment metagenome]|uniref:Uncharacterized protein n=1 Tax=marine sediment metagenome TaxID=412755 RepID=A0A0F9SWQ1_9ZZZZ